MVFEILITALSGAVLCLDRISIQIMISRPVFAGAIIGLILKDPYTGLIVGALIELIWIDRLPIGAAVPPNDTITAVIATAGVILAGRQIGAVSRELIALGIILCLPLGILGQIMDIWLMKKNSDLAREVLQKASEGDVKIVSRYHLKAVMANCLANSVFILIFLFILVQTLASVYQFIPLGMQKALVYTYLFLPILGISVALNTIHLRGVLPVFCGTFLILTVIYEGI